MEAAAPVRWWWIASFAVAMTACLGALHGLGVGLPWRVAAALLLVLGWVAFLRGRRG
jgi:hypothetical protein